MNEKEFSSFINGLHEMIGSLKPDEHIVVDIIETRLGTIDDDYDDD